MKDKKLGTTQPAPPKVRMVEIAKLKLDSKNANRGTSRGRALLESSLRKYGAGRAVLVDKNNVVIAGNKTVEAARKAGFKNIAVIESDDGTTLFAVQRGDLDLKTDKKAKALALADNRIGEVDLNWDPGVLMDFSKELDLSDLWDADELQKVIDAAMVQRDDGPPGGEYIPLTVQYGVPPFSVLDSRAGYWNDRKRVWLQTLKVRDHIEPEAGIKGNAFKRVGDDFFGARLRVANKHRSSTAFDPVMAEIAYRWFCVKNGTILDPFAGGPIRGCVAAYLGYEYTGIDVRPQQIASNIVEAKRSLGTLRTPNYIAGGSQDVIPGLRADFDFIFSSPPYGVEKYSDLPGDISNKKWPEFMTTYREIVAAAVAKLKDNRFACFVVGDSRGTGSFYHNFVSGTIQAFLDAGMQLYNEAILVTPAGSTGIMIKSFFPNYRKLGKTHQNVLVFFKGDVKKIPAQFGKIDITGWFTGAEADEPASSQNRGKNSGKGNRPAARKSKNVPAREKRKPRRTSEETPAV